MNIFENNLILLKFGIKCHLESLKAGNLYFNPISKYRCDGTSFRGDKNEGKIPINPSTFSINGVPFGKYIEPPMLSLEEDDDLLMFCTSMLTESILYFEDNKYVVKQEFKNAVQPFGDYVFMFRFDELAYKLKKIKESNISSANFAAPRRCVINICTFGFSDNPDILLILLNIS